MPEIYPVPYTPANEVIGDGDDDMVVAGRVLAGPGFISGYHSFYVKNPTNGDPVAGIGVRCDLDIDSETAAEGSDGFQHLFIRSQVRQSGSPEMMVGGTQLRLTYSIGLNSHIEHLAPIVIDGVINGDAQVDGYYGIRIIAPLVQGNAVVTGTSGIRIEDHSAVGDGNNFVSKGANANNHFEGRMICTGLPTSNPNSAGQLWNDNGTVKVSVG